MTNESHAKPTHLYLCSSVRHIYLTIGLALANPNVRHHLVLISQNRRRQNILAESLQRDSSLFDSFVTEYDAEGPFRKYRETCKILQRLKCRALELQPDKVFVGNDRKVEFQYIMHCLRETRSLVTGVYLDDGTGSYQSGRYMKRWSALTDQYVDRPLKKIVFGNWCDRVRFLGGTRWVDECYLNFPDLAPAAIKATKNIVQLPAKWYTSDEFRAHMANLLGPRLRTESGDDIPLGIDAFVVLPSSKFLAKVFHSIDEYNQLLNRYLSNFESIAIKYHPREKQHYFRSPKSVTVLPSSIPAEILFSLTEPKHIIGDISSAILSAAWLYPHIQTTCIWPRKVAKPVIFEVIEKTSVDVQEID